MPAHLETSTALVLVDFQLGVQWLFGPDLVTNAVRHAAALTRAFRDHGRPVIFVRVDHAPDGGDRLVGRAPPPFPHPQTPPPPDASALMPELGALPGDIVVTKRQAGAFYGTDLDLHLRRRKIETVVFGGVATSMGVESSARGAADRGYRLVFAKEALADPNPRAHAHCLETTFPWLGDVETTQDIVTALGPERRGVEPA